MGKLWISQDNGCWVDVWDRPNFNGNWLRLRGPADFVQLRIAESHWQGSIRSLVVGPTAYVQCFEDLNFSETVIWLLPQQRVMNMADLKSDEDLDSMRIYDRPPFAHEPGYSAYMLWAANAVANAAEKAKELPNIKRPRQPLRISP